MIQFDPYWVSKMLKTTNVKCNFEDILFDFNLFNLNYIIIFCLSFRKATKQSGQHELIVKRIGSLLPNLPYCGRISLLYFHKKYMNDKTFERNYSISFENNGF